MKLLSDLNRVHSQTKGYTANIFFNLIFMYSTFTSNSFVEYNTLFDPFWDMNHKKEKIKIYQIVLKLKAYHEYGMYS